MKSVRINSGTEDIIIRHLVYPVIVYYLIRCLISELLKMSQSEGPEDNTYNKYNTDYIRKILKIYPVEMKLYLILP